MLKRLVCFSLILALCVSCACAEDKLFSMKYIQDHPDAYEVDPLQGREDEASIITSIMTPQNRSFNHKYDSEYYYSTTQFDILVYYPDIPEEAQPLLRLWINFFSKKALNINSVSFVANNEQFTFKDVAISEAPVKTEQGEMREQLLVKFGAESADFLSTMVNILYNEDYKKINIKMILHGENENIEVKLGEGAILDAFFLVKGWAETNTLYYLNGPFEYTHMEKSKPKAKPVTVVVK